VGELVRVARDAVKEKGVASAGGKPIARGIGGWLIGGLAATASAACVVCAGVPRSKASVQSKIRGRVPFGRAVYGAGIEAAAMTGDRGRGHIHSGDRT